MTSKQSSTFLAVVEANERRIERMGELEDALEAVAVAFDWLAENHPKAMREMPGELFFPMWRKLNAVLDSNQETKD